MNEKNEFRKTIKNKVNNILEKDEISSDSLEELCSWISKEFSKIFPKDTPVEEIKGILSVMGAADMAKNFDDEGTIRALLIKTLKRLEKEISKD